MSDTIDLSSLADGSSSWLSFTFPSISINIGEFYYIFLSDPTYDVDNYFTWSVAMSDVYGGGIWSGNPSFDATFITYYDDTFVPEFNNLFLLFAGLIPILIFKIKKAK